MDSIREWLDEHKPVAPFGAVDAGKMVLASRGGNVWLALIQEPELRLEIVTAWISEAGDMETVHRRVRQLAEFIGAVDEAARVDD